MRVSSSPSAISKCPSAPIQKGRAGARPRRKTIDPTYRRLPERERRIWNLSALMARDPSLALRRRDGREVIPCFHRAWASAPVTGHAPGWSNLRPTLGAARCTSGFADEVGKRRVEPLLVDLIQAAVFLDPLQEVVDVAE